MARTNFENLRVYQLAEEVSDLIWTITAKWDWFSRSTIGKQVVEAADSVGANIAEGAGRYGTQDNKRFAYFARGSLNETKHWLRRAFRRQLLSADEIQKLQALLEELSPKLNAYINTLKNKPGPRSGLEHERTPINEQRTTNNERQDA